MIFETIAGAVYQFQGPGDGLAGWRLFRRGWRHAQGISFDPKDRLSIWQPYARLEHLEGDRLFINVGDDTQTTIITTRRVHHGHQLQFDAES